MQTSYSLDSFLVGPLIVDATRSMPPSRRSLVAPALFVFFRFTLVGKAIRACADNYIGALVVGLDVKRLYALTFGLGAACVGAAGAMLVLVIDVTPPLGPAYTLLAFVIVITGGLGSMPGALLGGVLIGAHRGARWAAVHALGQEHVPFGLLVLVLLFRPQGLAGQAARMMRACSTAFRAAAWSAARCCSRAAARLPLLAGDYCSRYSSSFSISPMSARPGTS